MKTNPIVLLRLLYAYHILAAAESAQRPRMDLVDHPLLSGPNPLQQLTMCVLILAHAASLHQQTHAHDDRVQANSLMDWLFKKTPSVQNDKNNSSPQSSLIGNSTGFCLIPDADGDGGGDDQNMR